MKNPIKFWVKYHILHFANIFKKEFKQRPCRLRPMACVTTYPTQNYQSLNLAQRFELIGNNFLAHNIICK